MRLSRLVESKDFTGVNSLIIGRQVVAANWSRMAYIAAIL
jgi:hypothetical protein